MEKSIKKLGRGIDALITKKVLQDTQNSFLDTKKIQDIPVTQLSANPYQPRILFDTTKIRELAESIKHYGILEPLLVTKTQDNQFTIVAGERRFRAAQVANLHTVPAIVLSLSEEEKLKISIIENVQRENLNPIELARSYKAALALSKLTQEELAATLGISRPVLTNTIRLLGLSDTIQDALITGTLSQSHARLLLSIEDKQKRETMFNKIILNDLTVKQLEKEIETKNQHKTTQNHIKPHKKVVFSSLHPYEEKLIEFFGTKVSISGSIDKGTVSIQYHNQKDFGRILELLHVTLE